MGWNLPDDVTGNEECFTYEEPQKKDYIVPLTIWVRESAYDKKEAGSQAFLSVTRDLAHYIEDADYHCCYDVEEDY